MFCWVAADFSLLTILLAGAGAGLGWGKNQVITMDILCPGLAGAGSCVEKYHKAGDHGRSLQTREREQQLQEAVN